MHYRPLPHTDLKVSLLGFGNFTFGADWWGDITDEQAVDIQNAAVDRGVNFFDTAPAYGDGRAESLLRSTIRYAGRDRLVVSTKFGYAPVKTTGHRERPQDFSPAFVRADLERSLTRLGIERIDLYQAHNIRLRHCTDELFDTLDRLVSEGKVGCWGVALGPAIGWREEGLAALTRGAAVVQTVMNLYEQDPGRALCEAAAASPTCGGVIARVPTNSGILDEEFADDRHTFHPNDHRKFRDRNWLTFGLKKNALVKPLADALGLSLRQFAFKWLAGQPCVVSIEPNILSLDDVQQFAAAADGEPLPPDVTAQLRAWYDDDFGLGDAAHPCDLKSSVAPGGAERSAHHGQVSA